MGKSPFHAKAMIWSTRSLGQVALNQTRKHTTAIDLATNQTCPGMGSKPFVPPRNRAVAMTAVAIGARNSASWKTANFMPLYSV